MRPTRICTSCRKRAGNIPGFSSTSNQPRSVPRQRRLDGPFDLAVETRRTLTDEFHASRSSKVTCSSLYAQAAENIANLISNKHIYAKNSGIGRNSHPWFDRRLRPDSRVASMARAQPGREVHRNRAAEVVACTRTARRVAREGSRGRLFVVLQRRRASVHFSVIGATPGLSSRSTRPPARASGRHRMAGATPTATATASAARPRSTATGSTPLGQPAISRVWTRRRAG